ncbi:MAG: hypothetical protein R3Y47_08795 [Lachnospiraceae bacterium]
MKIKIGIGIMSAVIAGLVFVLLLQIQENKKEVVEYREVLVTREAITKGTYIEEANLELLFEVKELPVEYMPDGVLTGIEDALDMVVQADLSQMTIMTKELLQSENSLYQAYDTLQWLSLAINATSQAVAGRLRSGDFIDIYTIDENEEGLEAVKVAEGVRIHKVYTKEGQLIDVSDQNSLAQMLEIPVQEEQVSEMLTSLDAESIRIVKYEDDETID